MTHNPPTSQQLDLDAIQARIDAASKGPWKLAYEYCDCSEDCGHGLYVSRIDTGSGPATELCDLPRGEWELMVHARADVEQLVAEVRRLRAAPPMECINCETPVGWVDCPTGGWWAHETHPADEHDAVPGAWVDGDELMETIAAEVWEHCSTEGTSLVVDDPRNIAGTAAAVARRMLAPAVPAVPVSSPPPNQTADERLSRVLEFVTSEVVTAKTEFGNGYREAQRDIRDLIRGRFDNDAANELRRLAAEAQQPDTETRGPAPQPDVCDTCDIERCETCHGCRCNKGDDNTCGYPDCPATRVKHSGPDTKFCVLCLSGEHERVDEPTPEPPAHIGGNADDCPACQAQGLHTIGHPYECPGPDTAA